MSVDRVGFVPVEGLSHHVILLLAMLVLEFELPELPRSMLVRVPRVVLFRVREPFRVRSRDCFVRERSSDARAYAFAVQALLKVCPLVVHTSLKVFSFSFPEAHFGARKSLFDISTHPCTVVGLFSLSHKHNGLSLRW